MSGNITSRARRAWASSALPVKHAPSTSVPATSDTCPFVMGHYVENTGTTPMRFLEIFKSSYFADVSLDQWMTLAPPELVEVHLKLDQQVWMRCARTKRPSCLLSYI